MQTPFFPHFDRQIIFWCPNQTSPRLSLKGSPTFCINFNFFPSRFFQDDEAGEGSDRPKPDVGRQVREKQNILFYFMCETALFARIANSNNTNATDIHDVYLSANAGDPYLDHFESTEAEKAVRLLFICVAAVFAVGVAAAAAVTFFLVVVVVGVDGTVRLLLLLLLLVPLLLLFPLLLSFYSWTLVFFKKKLSAFVIIFTNYLNYLLKKYEFSLNYAVKKDKESYCDHPLTTLLFLPLHVHTRPWPPPASRLRSTARPGWSQRSDPPSPTWRCSSSGRTRRRPRRYRQSTWADIGLLNRWGKQLASYPGVSF